MLKVNIKTRDPFAKINFFPKHKFDLYKSFCYKQSSTKISGAAKSKIKLLMVWLQSTIKSTLSGQETPNSPHRWFWIFTP